MSRLKSLNLRLKKSQDKIIFQTDANASPLQCVLWKSMTDSRCYVPSVRSLSFGQM